MDARQRLGRVRKLVEEAQVLAAMRDDRRMIQMPVDADDGTKVMHAIDPVIRMKQAIAEAISELGLVV